MCIRDRSSSNASKSGSNRTTSPRWYCSSHRTTRACARHMSTSSMPAGVECIWALAAKLGEGALWSARERAVWFVDIKGRQIHRYDEATRTRRSWPAPEDVGFIVAASGGHFILSLIHISEPTRL